MRHRELMIIVIFAAPLSPYAQSFNVLSGYLDVGIYRNFDGQNHIGTIQRSNLAFSGGEDLGNNLSIIYRLSHRFEMGTGENEGGDSKPMWHDEATLGFRGNFGTLKFGRALTALWSSDWRFDGWANFNRIASPAWQFWHTLAPSDRYDTNGTPDYGRINNGVFYTSPKFANFSVSLSGASERTLAANNGRNISGALVYDDGTLGAMLSSEKNGSGDKVLFLAGKYSFGNWELHTAYDRSEMNGLSAKATAITFDISRKIEFSTIRLGYGTRKFSGTRNHFLGLGYEYALSKRTLLYASAGRFSRKVTDTKQAYGVGVAHAF